MIFSIEVHSPKYLCVEHHSLKNRVYDAGYTVHLSVLILMFSFGAIIEAIERVEQNHTERSLVTTKRIVGRPSKCVAFHFGT